MKRFLILIGAILLGLTVRAQSVTYTCRYWFDRDTEQVTTTFTGNTAQMELNVSTMTDGLHTLHVQVMDTTMAWCAPYSYYFIKIDDTPDEEKSYTYWFDRDYEGRQTGTLASGVLFIDVAGLRDGLHTLHLATIGSTMNNTYSYMIVKHPVLQPESQLEYRCWFDQNDSTLVTGPVGDGYCLVDVSALPIGDHYMNLQLADGTSLDILMGFGITRTPMVLVTAEPEAGGTATAQLVGSTCTVSASPNEGYDFTGWTHNSQVISTVPEMSFILESDTAFVATFLLRSYQIAATANLPAGGTVTGAGTYHHFDECTLTATPAQGYIFVNWTENGEVVSTEAEYTFIVESGRTLVANFLRVYDHTEALAAGWNWWSTYIEQNGFNGLDMLENSLGESGIRIQSRNDGYTEYFESGLWYGSLQQIANEQMYMIHTNAACEAAVTGPIADVIDHPISLSSGWNWVGYPVEQSINLSNALSNLSPEANDMIKSRYGYSVYVVYQNNGFWYGTLNNLEFGKGYMYKSNSEVGKTFVYNTQRGGTLVENVTAEGNIFQPVDGDYAYNMAVTAVVDLGGSELRSADYELAAFVGDECRGSVRLIYVEPLNRYVAFLTVYGDIEETLDFVLTDGEDLCWSDDHIVYEANGIVGTLAAPAELHFSPLGVDEMMGNVHVYPNPSNGVFNVSGVGVRKVEVVNAYGQVVYSLEAKDDTLRIDLSNMAVGTYLLRVVADGGVATRKLVKK